MKTLFSSRGILFLPFLVYNIIGRGNDVLDVFLYDPPFA